MTEGPFIEAFNEEEGDCLLLDEINLVPVSVLQFIEKAIDTGIISIEIAGLPLKEYKMRPNFCLIATQNKRTKFYKDKRESAGIKFLSKFQIVNFPELGKFIWEKKNEDIGNKINDDKEKNNEDDIISGNYISKLFNFHIDWNK